MAQKSFPWTNNGTGDGTSGGYTALEWGEVWRQTHLAGTEATDGVLVGVGSALAVTGTSSPLSLGTGAAYVYGKFYQNTSITTSGLSVTTPVVGTTGGHVILNLDWTAQTVRVSAVRNTDGVNSTPSLTQSTSTNWQIRLATFTITTGGVIAVTDARTYAHFATAIATANIDASAVTTAKIADSNVTTAKINDSAVTEAKIADGAVSTNKLASSAVDETKIATGAAGNGLGGGAGTPLFVKTDNTTLGISADTVGLINTVSARAGGSATNWQTTGTASQTPGNTNIQVGKKAGSGSSGSSGTYTVSFVNAFSNNPLVFLQTSDKFLSVSPTSVSTTGFTVSWASIDGNSYTPPDVSWLAIGPT